MIAMALFMLTSTGGVTIAAIRLGQSNHEGANRVFMYSFTATVIATAVLSAVGVFFTEPLARILGANDFYLLMVKDYLFWYSLFIIPSGLSVNLQSFYRNDGSPILVGVSASGTACCVLDGSKTVRRYTANWRFED